MTIKNKVVAPPAVLETRYRCLFESAKDGILFLDAETGMIQDVNPILVELLGYSYEQFVEKAIWEIGFFKDIVANKEKFVELQQKEFVRYEDLPLETADGRRINVEFVSNVYAVDSHKVIQCIIRDITDRRRVEEALRESEIQFREIFDGAPIGYHELNTEGRITRVNRCELAMLGYSAAEMLGCFVWEFVDEADSSRHNVMEKLAGVLPPGRDLERIFCKKDGTKIPVLTQDRLLRDKHGRITGIRTTLQDITERKATEQVLRDVQRRESLGVLTSGIAHDYNNLLGIMMGNVSLSQSLLSVGHPAAKNLEKALLVMERAAELTQQMLAYSGKGKYHIGTIDIGAVVQEHASLFTVSLSKNVKLVTTLPSRPVFVNGDHGQIEQIIMNLIINGGEAIGDRQGVVSITLTEVAIDSTERVRYEGITNTSLADGRYAMLRVADNGKGMTRETMDKIFDPFFTTKFTGRGLGLSAVLGIIQGHKGGITVESEDGAGTTFCLILPAVPPPQAAEAPMAVVPMPQAAASRTILVIDDEEDIATVAQEMLETGKYTVLVERNPLRGIELYKQHRSEIGAVLLDLTMPEMSGKEVVEILSAVDPDVKIIISSGYSEEEVIKKIGAAKVSAFIQKPYRLQSLLTVVHTVVFG